MSQPDAEPRTGAVNDASAHLDPRAVAAAAGSVIADLEPFEWDQDAAIAYELAVDTIALVIAAHTGVLAAQDRQQNPDPTGQQEALAAIARAAADQRALVGADPTEIARITDTYTEELRRLGLPAVD